MIDFNLQLNIFAYLDPGTGSFILQLVIGVLFGALFALKLFWHKIKLFFQGFFSREKKDEKNEQ